MGVLAAAVAAALGFGAAWGLRHRPRALGAARGIGRWLAALCATAFAAAFAAGVVGAVASGDHNPVLITLALGLIVAAALLWRGRRRPRAVGGHAVAALWLLYSAFAARHSPGASLLFIAVSLPALFTAAVGVDLALPPSGRDGPGEPRAGEGGRPWRGSQ